MRASDKAKRIHALSGGVSTKTRAPSTALSPSLDSELRDSWERAVRIHKAETIGAAMDIKRSRAYEIAGNPGETQARHLIVLAEFDPDPEFIPRLAHALLAWAAGRAARRHNEGGRVLIIEGKGRQLGLPLEKR